MEQKNLIIICVTAIVCVAILSGTLLFLNNGNNNTQTNNSTNDSVNITLNDTNDTNNTTTTTTTKTKKSTKTQKKQNTKSSDEDEEWYDVVVPGTEGKETVRAKPDKFTEYGHRYITEDGDPIYV